MTDQVIFKYINFFYKWIVKDVAPPEILKVIRCNCKLKARSPCSSNLCSCRQNGLSCVAACGECRGMNCANKSREPQSDVEDDDDI